MDERAIDMLVTKTMAEILRHITIEGGEVCVNNQGLDALRAALKPATLSTGAGARIIESLQDAVAGNFARVTIEGQTWVRLDQ